ncbi:hypothetical protein QBC40DRAFT_229710 [Triangularia verruculosa]|uniref:Zinc finger Mcm10/DnaG-type domain-containing protein n=1 Tax=Triangularia verruculosa TaxID=2587418 RepID=A0AAN6XDN2_9PEZI|nr:hypothetical protein QBC40DRAFT_229710 [Triangularia verruculosa]
MAAQWPPRSPHEALLSTPGGREKLRRLTDRSSPSPSPSKLRNSRSQPSLGMGEPMYDGAMDLDEEEEDEEMLQLKLQAIQAKLKLKKLQAAKAHKKSASLSESRQQDGGATSGAVGGTREIPFQSRLALARERIERLPSQAPVEVPASPVRKSATTSNLDTSPKRVLLGIDKGRKATEMSLKRPSQRQLGSNPSGQQQSQGNGVSSFLRRAKSPETARPLSFNERLASARTEETARQEQAKRVQKARSTAFSIGKQEMEDYKAKAQDLPEIPYKPEELSRDQLMSALGRSNSTTAPSAPTGYLRRSRTASDLRNTINHDSSDLFLGAPSVSSSFSAPENKSTDSSFDIFSSFHLSKRILPHPVLARAVASKKIYQLKDLLKHVKAPDWSLPDIETDIVVFAILASKSDPRSHRPGPSGTQSDRGKYMVLTLVDLQFEVELYLFNSGFDRFYKLTPGTVVAILNPSILPPPPGREATGRFGLVINSDEDTILEVGKSRDLGYCKSVKKDGTLCNGWVNGRRTEYCEYHTNEAVKKARSGRIELNNTFGSGGGDAKKPNSKDWWGKKEKQDTNQGYDRFTGTKYFVSGGRGPGMGDADDENEIGMADRAERQEALKRRLLKREKERDIARQLGSWGGGAGKDYMSRAAAGQKAGSSFTSSTVGSSQPGQQQQSGSSFTNGSFASTVGTSFGSLDGQAIQGSQQQQRRYDAAALGLTGRRGTDAPKVELGPVKRKRPVSSASSSTVSTVSQIQSSRQAQQQQPKVALGWGSGLSSKLGRMKEGERLDGRKMEVESLIAASRAARDDKSPVRKKTRFVTEKGIREAGRESLGEGLGVSVGGGTVLTPGRGLLGRGLSRRGREVVLDDDDEEDDLIIVK